MACNAAAVACDSQLIRPYATAITSTGTFDRTDAKRVLQNDLKAASGMFITFFVMLSGEGGISNNAYGVFSGIAVSPIGFSSKRLKARKRNDSTGSKRRPRRSRKKKASVTERIIHRKWFECYFYFPDRM